MSEQPDRARFSVRVALLVLRGYQLIDFSGWYEAHRGVTFYANLGNVLSQQYEAVFGYPALPFTFRSGVRFTLGGEGWKRK